MIMGASPPFSMVLGVVQSEFSKIQYDHNIIHHSMCVIISLTIVITFTNPTNPPIHLLFWYKVVDQVVFKVKVVVEVVEKIRTTVIK